ncbi:MAG: hypothetical protein B6245_10525 [Desulfobacteraceae bacterium 4572_88]|nr:MAG: hypothetical protein B6245_10525 [Desulfobacteraceae bacterium 4572_88]
MSGYEFQSFSEKGWSVGSEKWGVEWDVGSGKWEVAGSLFFGKSLTRITERSDEMCYETHFKY